MRAFIVLTPHPAGRRGGRARIVFSAVPVYGIRRGLTSAPPFRTPPAKKAPPGLAWVERRGASFHPRAKGDVGRERPSCSGARRALGAVRKGQNRFQRRSGPSRKYAPAARRGPRPCTCPPAPHSGRNKGRDLGLGRCRGLKALVEAARRHGRAEHRRDMKSFSGGEKPGRGGAPARRRQARRPRRAGAAESPRPTAPPRR